MDPCSAFCTPSVASFIVILVLFGLFMNKCLMQNNSEKNKFARNFEKLFFGLINFQLTSPIRGCQFFIEFFDLFLQKQFDHFYADQNILKYCRYWMFVGIYPNKKEFLKIGRKNSSHILYSLFWRCVQFYTWFFKKFICQFCNNSHFSKLNNTIILMTRRFKNI